MFEIDWQAIEESNKKGPPHSRQPLGYLLRQRRNQILALNDHTLSAHVFTGNNGYYVNT